MYDITPTAFDAWDITSLDTTLFIRKGKIKQNKRFVDFESVLINALFYCIRSSLVT